MSKKHFAPFRAKQLERLAKVDLASITPQRKLKIRKRLRRTIDFAAETNRPDRAEWCGILLKKFAAQGEKNK